MPQLLSVAEAARRLRRNPVLVYRWINEGRIRATKVGRAVIVDERELERFAKHPPERRPARARAREPRAAPRRGTDVE